MAATLETLEHLALWCQGMGRVYETTLADPFAQMVLERATELVVEAAALPALWETDPTLVPSRCRTIALLLAARTYTNPRSIINEGVGPISESMLAKMAAAMELTPDEREELEAIAMENGGDYGGLWVLSTTTGPESRMDPVYVPTVPETTDWLLYGDNGQTDAFVPMTLLEEPPPEGVDPVAFAALQTQVATLLSSVSGLDATKAEQTELDALETTVAGKANTTDVNTALAGKASTTALTSGLAGKASQSSVDSLSTTVAGKASQTDLDAATADIVTLETTVAGKASQAELDALEAEVATKADASDLGPQIQVGDTPPASGSGLLWADPE